MEPSRTPYAARSVKFPQWTFVGFPADLPVRPHALRKLRALDNALLAFRTARNELRVVGADPDAVRRSVVYAHSETPDGCWVDMAPGVMTQHFEPPPCPAATGATSARRRKTVLDASALTVMANLLDGRRFRVADHAGPPCSVALPPAPTDLQGEAVYAMHDLLVHHRYYLPFTSVLTLYLDAREDGACVTVWDSVLPVSDRECVVFSKASQNFDQHHALRHVYMMPYEFLGVLRDDRRREPGHADLLACGYDAALRHAFPELAEFFAARGGHEG